MQAGAGVRKLQPMDHFLIYCPTFQEQWQGQGTEQQALVQRGV